MYRLRRSIHFVKQEGKLRGRKHSGKTSEWDYRDEMEGLLFFLLKLVISRQKEGLYFSWVS